MKRVICKKPLIHRPEFEGKFHCKRCAEEARVEAEKFLDLIDKRVQFSWIQTSGTGLDANWSEEE
tara:strand:- start:104 stop:298 length:195 start_codon:yes stop_codon:yes gene_type:complete